MRLHAKFGGDTAPAKAPPTPAPATRMAAMDASVSPAARNLALAHYVARLIDQGLLADFTAAARALGVSQVRMTHLMSLLLLAPQVQEAILAGTISPTVSPSFSRGGFFNGAGAACAVVVFDSATTPAAIPSPIRAARRSIILNLIDSCCSQC